MAGVYREMSASRKLLTIEKSMGAVVILDYLHLRDIYVLLPLAFTEPQIDDISGAWSH